MDILFLGGEANTKVITLLPREFHFEDRCDACTLLRGCRGQ